MSEETPRMTVEQREIMMILKPDSIFSLCSSCEALFIDGVSVEDHDDDCEW